MSKLYIWSDRVFYLGRLPDVTEHRLGGAALCIGVERAFEVLESESSAWQTCRSVLIPPGCLHEIRFAGATLAIIFLEPESDHYSVVRTTMSGGDWQCLYRLAHEDQAIAWVQELAHNAYDAATTYRLVGQVIDPQGVVPHAGHSLDGRIDRVMQLIKEDVSHSYSVEALAAAVNLSPTRLVHLFKEQTGVPIRRFRQWNRMKAVVAGVAAEETLTDAALNAGFSDSAHFSRAFRNMFGIKPSFLFKRSSDLEIFIG